MNNPVSRPSSSVADATDASAESPFVRYSPSGRFYAGILFGVAISAANWIFFWPGYKYVSVDWILIVLGVKLAMGFSFFAVRRWQYFGAGIIISIALGAIIFGSASFVDIVNAFKWLPRQT